MVNPMPPAAPLPPMRLLITDREPASRDALMGLLRNVSGFEFIGAVPPGEAIRQAALRRVNVVLLDVFKPHADSARLCRDLCALPSPPTVIALTTFADPAEELDLRRAGASGYLLKEVNLGRLVRAIRLILGRERSTPDR